MSEEQVIYLAGLYLYKLLVGWMGRVGYWVGFLGWGYKFLRY